jgi:hypothetical protein
LLGLGAVDLVAAIGVAAGAAELPLPVASFVSSACAVASTGALTAAAVTAGTLGAALALTALRASAFAASTRGR